MGDGDGRQADRSTRVLVSGPQRPKPVSQHRVLRLVRSGHGELELARDAATGPAAGGLDRWHADVFRSRPRRGTVLGRGRADIRRRRRGRRRPRASHPPADADPDACGRRAEGRPSVRPVTGPRCMLRRITPDGEARPRTPARGTLGIATLSGLVAGTDPARPGDIRARYSPALWTSRVAVPWRAGPRERRRVRSPRTW